MYWLLNKSVFKSQLYRIDPCAWCILQFWVFFAKTENICMYESVGIFHKIKLIWIIFPPKLILNFYSYICIVHYKVFSWLLSITKTSVSFFCQYLKTKELVNSNIMWQPGQASSQTAHSLAKCELNVSLSCDPRGMNTCRKGGWTVDAA